LGDKTISGKFGLPDFQESNYKEGIKKRLNKNMGKRGPRKRGEGGDLLGKGG